jgi:hypothetical protein
MSLSYTETTNASSIWELIPYYIAEFNVSPPEAFLDFHPIEAHIGNILTEYEIVAPSESHIIDRHTHEALLKKSVREFGDIWRTLARM